MPTINYNERSWAIDVISEINLFLSNKDWHFKSAGGENTIKNEKSSLFPDVLIFRDLTKEIILQGWELKMPDTPINDIELINNAIKKAKILQRDSFVLWNVKSAVLYVKNGDVYSILKSWNDIAINSRSEVRTNETLWKTLLHTILEDLNNYFGSGNISDNVLSDILAIDKVIDVILENISSTAENLKNRTRSDAKLSAIIDKWWLSSAIEYGLKLTNDNDKKFYTLSKVILTDWVFKIIFANVLKRHFNKARSIETIGFGTTINEAKKVITEISEHCDFWNIFSDNLAIEQVSETAWKQIIQLNLFLSTINIDGVEIEILHNLLQSSIAHARRKVAGQFATPQKLADLLTRLTIDNKNGIVIDPCCGTGTIIKQVYSLKQEYGIAPDSIIENIWASDKYSFPIQLSTLTLSKPDNIGKILNVFTADVTSLQAGQTITFKNPNNGNNVEKILPRVDYVVSNLPFIKSKEIEVLNPTIIKINHTIQTQTSTVKSLSGKSDIFAYIPFYLHNIISNNGRIGLILSNSWLGTDYGEIFLELIQKYFDIETVVISGKGKWFDNADVVTTLFIATKRNLSAPENLDRSISFCTLREKIEEMENIKQLSDNIILGTESEHVKIQSYTLNQIHKLENLGMPWCSYLTCAAEAEAFCCSKSVEELKALNHIGALNWIRSFENQTNEAGIPLTKSLHKANMYWYEMNTNNMADFVANINYDKSLFIAGFGTRSFIDQRMIGFSVKAGYQTENKMLFLALFNSIISMFFIESFGFGRGLGALDLRATKFEKDFKILKPGLLTEEQKEKITNAFQPITERNRLPLEQEILQRDRINFEQILFNTYGITQYYDVIKEALLHLYRIRFAVKN